MRSGSYSPVREVEPTTSANKTLTGLMTLGDGAIGVFQFLGDLGRQNVNVKLSDLSCSAFNWAIAESFWFEKYWSMKNATSEGPKTFITKTAMTTAFGRLFSSSPENSNTPLTTSSNPYVNNHQTACFRSANINAPRGHSSAQMITPLPRTTPPNASITTKGNSKIRTS